MPRSQCNPIAHVGTFCTSAPAFSLVARRQGASGCCCCCCCGGGGGGGGASCLPFGGRKACGRTTRRAASNVTRLWVKPRPRCVPRSCTAAASCHHNQHRTTITDPRMLDDRALRISASAQHRSRDGAERRADAASAQRPRRAGLAGAQEEELCRHGHSHSRSAAQRSGRGARGAQGPPCPGPLLAGCGASGQANATRTHTRRSSTSGTLKSATSCAP